MKKIYSLILASFLLVFSHPVFAWDWNWDWDWDSLDFSVEARVAYFHPSSKKVRRIYSEGWADYQLEFSAPLGCNWRLWSGVSGFSRKGHSIGFYNDTRLQLIPISLGLKYVYPIAHCTSIYVGGAACYSSLRIKDHSDYVHEHTRKRAFGGIAQVGLYYSVTDWLFLDVFADYYFQRFHFKHHSYISYDGSGYDSSSRFVERNTLNMSGYKVGAGVGVTF